MSNDQSDEPTTSQEKLERARTELAAADSNIRWMLAQKSGNGRTTPALHEGLGDGLEAFERCRSLLVDVMLSSMSGETVADCERRRGKVAFGNILNAGLFEKLKAMCSVEDVTITTVLHRGLRHEIEQEEAMRGEPYIVYPPHQIDESKYAT
jgi:hypothetical protein